VGIPTGDGCRCQADEMLIIMMLKLCDLMDLGPVFRYWNSRFVLERSPLEFYTMYFKKER
jgi:hypothetical protein